MTDLEGFRRETRDWLEKNCPPEMRRPMLVESDTFWGGRNATFQSEAQRVWFERMRDRKWIVPHWPAEYGGGGLDPARAKIVREEMAAISARPAAALVRHHDDRPDAARVRHRGAEARAPAEDLRGEIRWCQGYSEPGAGSDLASLQTRADARRRPLRRQRPEDLDVVRRQGRLDLLPGAHRLRRAKKHEGITLPADRHDDARASRPSRSC